MDRARRIENYIDSLLNEKDFLNNLENQVCKVYDYCWKLLEEYIDIINSNESNSNNTIMLSFIARGKDGLFDEILLDFYITNGGFPSQYVSAYKLDNIASDSSIKLLINHDSVSPKTFQRTYDSISIENSVLYNELTSLCLIDTSQKNRMFNPEFWQELFYLQKNYQSLNFSSDFGTPTINTLLSEDNLNNLQKFYAKTNHKALLLGYLNRQYQLDYYLLSLSYLKEYMSFISKPPLLPEDWNKEGASKRQRPLSYIAKLYIENLANKIAHSIPYSLLSYNATKKYCLYLYYEPPKMLSMEKSGTSEQLFNNLYPKMVDFGLPEFFLKNSFLYALEYLGSKLPKDIWRKHMDYKDNPKIQPVNVEIIFRDLKKDTRDYPYNAETLLDLLSLISLPPENMYPSGYTLGLPYNKTDLVEMISDEKLDFVYKKCLRMDSIAFYNCIYHRAEDYLSQF